MPDASGVAVFWKRRTPEPEPETAGGLGSELVAIRLFTADAAIDGWIDSGRQRLSDILNVEELLSIAPNAHPRDDDWSVLERDQILAIVPPPRTTDRAVRLHRVKRSVEVKIDAYVVRGTVHLIAGIQLDPFLARSGQHFLPVTEAWITSSSAQAVNESHPVILVNVRTAHPIQLKVAD